MPLQVGETINGRYRILVPISQGGFGAVYRAWDENLDQVVALKENMHVSPEAQRQFRREATLLANLRHPNLPRVIDHFVLPDLGQYLIMDFIEGRSLAELLQERGRPFTEAEVLPWIRQVCSALAYLHDRQPPIIHRDIKPQNIVITPEGQATLVDFGISKVLAEELTTTVGARGITPGYSPPEQYGGTTDARSDIYALGATLYALLAGRKPTDSVLLVAGNEQLAPPRQMNEALKPGTEATILKAMQLDRSKRFVDINSLLAALEQDKAVADDATVLDVQPLRPQIPIPARIKEQAAKQGALAEPPSSNVEGSKRIPVWAWLAGVLALAAVTFWGWQLGAGNTGTVVATITPNTNAPAVVELVTETAAPEASPTLPTATDQATNTPAVLPAETPTPLPQVGDTRVMTLPGGLEVTQVFVPAGSFLRGSAADDPLAQDDEKPQREVTLDSSFWLDQTEVTNAQFAEFVEAAEYETTAEQQGDGYTLNDQGTFDLVEGANWLHPYGPLSDIDGMESHPVVLVSWEDADTFCQWRDSRLPSEAEWEYAARGPDSPIYPWGNEFDGTLLNFCDESCEFDQRDATANDGYARIAPVGNYPEGASWVGAFDMSGNVWEWVNDWYDSGYYENAPAENPIGPETGPARVLRGGAWGFIVQFVRAADRSYNVPANRYNDVGFRCAQE